MSAGWRRIVRLDALVLTSGLWFLAKLLRYAFPPLFEPLQGIYGISNTQIGLAFSGLMACYALMQFPAGVFQDRLGPVRVMVAGGAVAAVAAVGLYAEAGFAGLVVAMLVMGAATGLHKTVSIPLLAGIYSRHTGRALGFHDTIGAAAGVAAPVLALWFLGGFGWRWFFVAAGLGGIVLAGLAFLRVSRRITSSVVTEAGDPPRMGRYFDLFRSGRFTAFVVVTSLFAFTYNGLVAFLPLYLVQVGGLDVTLAGTLYSVLFAATVVQLGTGELSDRVGRIPIMGVCILLGVGGLAGLLMAESTVALGGAVVAYGIAGHGYRPVRDAFLTDLIPEQTMGGGIGLIRSLLMGMASIAPGIVGIVADHAGFRAGFGLLTASLVGSALALAVLIVLTDGTA